MATAKNPKLPKAKLSGDFKDFLTTGKNNTRVLGALEHYIVNKPDESDRRTDVLHPSEMVKADWCHRSSYFQLLGETPPKSKYAKSMRMSMVFANGHAIHERYQTVFKDMGTLWGKYKCLECDQFFAGLPSEHDAKIPSSGYEYREVSLNYAPLKIAGHADGLLVGFGEPLMLEIKSIGPGTFRFEDPSTFYENDGHLDKMWKTLSAPFQSHVAQVQVYMRLAELLEFPYIPQEAVMIYENKGSQETKEFIVPKSNFSIGHVFEAAAMISKAVDNKTPPPCNIGGSKMCKKCEGYRNV